MTEVPPLPEYTDPADKFKPRREPCTWGGPITDHAIRTDGVICCSGCRAPMQLAVTDTGLTWVHGGHYS